MPCPIQFATGWRTDELMLNGQTLAAGVAEFNRYRPEKIIVGDESLENLRLGGRFSLHDPADFLSSLHNAFDITSVKEADGSIRRRSETGLVSA